MNREIELKIPLKKEEYLKILQKIKDNDDSLFLFKNVQKILKKDEYFSRFKTYEERRKNNESEVIRMRTQIIDEKQQTFFTIKRKSIQNGIETNCENETFIENPNVLYQFFNESGFIKWFSKEKNSISTICNCKKIEGNLNFHLELLIVNNLYYLEVEILDQKIDEKNAKSALCKFVEILGLNSKNADSRSWAEILAFF